jgi:hypothetical protein
MARFRNHRRQIPEDGYFQLSHGRDFFRSAWGNNFTDEAIAEMYRAWRDPDTRAEVLEEIGAFGPHVRPFAWHLFGDGTRKRLPTVADAKAALEAYRRERGTGNSVVIYPPDVPAEKV